MGQFEDDACNECDFCGNIWAACTCKEEDTQEEQIYITPRNNECKILRETTDTVTLMIYDNPNDPKEWTTTKRNFEKNYKKKES